MEVVPLVEVIELETSLEDEELKALNWFRFMKAIEIAMLLVTLYETHEGFAKASISMGMK